MKKHAKCVFFLLLVEGCAAAPKSKSAAPRSETASPAGAVSPVSPSTPGYPTAYAPAEPAPLPSQAPAPSQAPSPPAATTSPADGKPSDKKDAAKGAPGAGRSQVDPGGEMDRAQRELDVSGGNCVNACRALGSMDRAAGRLCGLARSSDERDRCSDAATKVKTARDRVKRTCGSCPDVTVERDAAIPSR